MTRNVFDVEQAEYSVNPERGCGTKKLGGSYLEASSSPFGMLRRVVWTLGTHVDGRITGDNVFTAASARSMELINPAATLVAGHVVLPHARVRFKDKFQEQEYLRLIKVVGELGLLDRVGSSFYSPWSFAEELWNHGPSRKVSRDFMIKIAPLLPLPVFFAHADMPIFQDVFERDDALYAATNGLIECDIDPTWRNKEWGLTIREADDGSNHFMIPILQAENADRECNEMLFCASWFTRGTYVLKDDNDAGVDAVNVANVII